MMKSGKFVRKGIALCLAVTLLTAGCGKTAETAQEPDSREASASVEESGQPPADTAGDSASGENEDLVSVLRAKYDAGVIDYSGETITIDREEAIQIKLGYNPWDETAKDVNESFVVYQDAELKYPLEAGSYDWDTDSGMLTIEPPVYGPAEVMLMEESDLAVSYAGDDDEIGWGNLPQLYLATYVDTETGDSIQGNPLVTVLKLKAGIEQAPQVRFSQDEYGSARFSWKEVPGAEEYLLFKIKKNESGLDGVINVLAATADTEWTAEQTMSMDESFAVTMNDMFSQYLVSEDYRGEVEEDDYDYADGEEYYGVIAVNSSGNSHISNLLNGNELAHMLPYTIAYNTNDETNGVSCTGTLNLPATMGIVMCDGSVSQRVLEYDKDSIEKSVDDSFYNIECKAYGTPFTSSYHVTDQDWDTLEKELDEVEDRQEKLKKKGGNVEADISLVNGEEVGEPAKSEETQGNTESEESNDESVSEQPNDESVSEESNDESVSEEPKDKSISEESEEETVEEASAGAATQDEILPDEETPEAVDEAAAAEDGKGADAAIDTGLTGGITANSALSEYLAIQMLRSEEAIDISDFPEAADTALVVDAFLEAQYQNPLILGIQEVGMDTSNGILYILYDDDAQTTAAKRNELQEKVSQITEEIITDGMSELDKELAINQYLCDNAEYDDGALENAAENDFSYVDEMYNDSFTAYGVLVNNVGVCASYSAGFKLLADAAGLESIVVTGYLDGNLPHAWNKVKLDGQWNIVDSTNNDNEVIQNALFNLSDDAAYGTLVEDDRFVLDNSIYDYDAPSDDKEYYHITDNYYTVDEIKNVLVEKLQTEGKAVLRTDYNLDDETFSSVAQETADEVGANISGLYWMGVIRLEQR